MPSLVLSSICFDYSTIKHSAKHEYKYYRNPKLQHTAKQFKSKFNNAVLALAKCNNSNNEKYERLDKT
ncbi:4097_t:CDS:2 [Dentiscutata erythropus]|uniref:4097_t:CDS:1 n=1 Tax=Dentiscutata erythropus TaxID=1348616 RepID=A0A9N9ER25_9GLOM|nr:4097_t:CDS:2 [Dentiscutata erythropus]